jgi:uncharacterized protein YndB with AHSA1/START domain
MAAITHSIEVNAPLHAVYNQWTQFEEFPRFMEGVEQVRQEGEKRLFWKAKIGGKVKEWEAEIVDQVPDERIAWQSVDGSPNSGTVTFEEIGPDRTRVTATIVYEPEGFLEKTGDALGFPSGRVQADLERFHGFIEERGRRLQNRIAFLRSFLRFLSDSYQRQRFDKQNPGQVAKNRSFTLVEAHAVASNADSFEGTEPARIGPLGTAAAIFRRRIICPIAIPGKT